MTQHPLLLLLYTVIHYINMNNDLKKLEQQLEAREKTLRERQEYLNGLEARVQALKAKKLELDSLEAEQNAQLTRLNAELAELGIKAEVKAPVSIEAPELAWKPFFFGLSNQKGKKAANATKDKQAAVSLPKPPKKKKDKKGSKKKRPVNKVATAITVGAAATLVGRGLTNIPTLQLEARRLELERERLELTQQELATGQNFAARQLDPASNALKKVYERCFWLISEAATKNGWADLPPTEQLEALLADPVTGQVVRNILSGAKSNAPGDSCASLSPSS